MPFDLELWRNKVAEGAQGVRAWVALRERRVEAAAPHLLYAGLCGMTLWPLVEAAQQGQFLPVMGALATVAAGVGGDLVAEQIQRWRDAAGPEPLTTWVEQEVPGNAQLREALDAVLVRLDTVPAVQAGLSEADRAWFDARLRQELAALGNLPRFEAHLTGGGAIAQGQGRAVGAHGVLVEGSVHGDVVTGTKTTTFDQRGQQVGHQMNVAGDYRRGGRGAPKADDPS